MHLFWVAIAVCAAVLLVLVALSIGLSLTHASDREIEGKAEAREIGGEE